jgi:uncharacterized protein (TIGR03086 family)
MEPLVAHQRALDAFAGVLANISVDALGSPTPCEEWTIRDLIEHVIGGNELVGPWGGSPDEPAPRPDDLFAANRAAAAAAQEFFARPDGLTTMYKLPFGELPGQFFIGIRTADVLTHAWDLATASGQSSDIDPELATETLAALRAFVGAQFRGPGKPFHEEQPCSGERAPADQLAAFLGRRV